MTFETEQFKLLQRNSKSLKPYNGAACVNNFQMLSSQPIQSALQWGMQVTSLQTMPVVKMGSTKQQHLRIFTGILFLCIMADV